MSSARRLAHSPKYSDATYAAIAILFASAAPVATTALITGLSPKTIRGVYLGFRARLLEPKFNRWHATNNRLIDVSTVGGEAIVRAGFFLVMSQCANNTTCGRNWRLGNRSRRQCRTCPLAKVLSDDDRPRAYTIIDELHSFYERIGIRGEKDRNSIGVFRERLVHLAIIASVGANSRKLPNGMIDPAEKTYLSGGTLVHLLLAAPTSLES